MRRGEDPEPFGVEFWIALFIVAMVFGGGHLIHWFVMAVTQ